MSAVIARFKGAEFKIKRMSLVEEMDIDGPVTVSHCWVAVLHLDGAEFLGKRRHATYTDAANSAHEAVAHLERGEKYQL